MAMIYTSDIRPNIPVTFDIVCCEGEQSPTNVVDCQVWSARGTHLSKMTIANAMYRPVTAATPDQII